MKFDKFKELLRYNDKPFIELSEQDLNRLIEGGLTESAFRNRSYFSNTNSHTLSNIWLGLGYRCTKVDRYSKYIILTKVSHLEDKIVSSDFLFYFYSNRIVPKFKMIISPFSYADVLKRFGPSQKDLNIYLFECNSIFIDFSGKKIDLEAFIDITDNLSLKISEHYKNLVFGVFTNCLINIGVSIELIFDYYYSAHSFNVLYVDENLRKQSLRPLFTKFCKEVCDLSIEEAISQIKKLDITSLSFGFTPNLSAREEGFYKFAIRQFVENVKTKSIVDVQPTIIVETENVELLSTRDDCVYLTNQTYTSEAIVSSLRLRVVDSTYEQFK